MPITERLAASLQASLAGGHFAIAIGAAFLGGLLTAFTGCVYPLIPITIRYFGAMRGASRAHVVLRASVYVGGMVLLYASLGTASASLRLVFGAALASPWTIAIIAAFCFAMGLSMLGLFTLQLPTDLNTRLTKIGGSGVGGAFLMGLVSGIIAAPCTGPVLAVILALIAAEHSVFFGFALMIAFGLGMGLPFLLLALFGGAFARLSATRGVFATVKIALSSIMFVVAIYFLDIAWPALGTALAKLPAAAHLDIVLLAIGLLVTIFYQRQLNKRGADALKILAVVLLSLAGGLFVVASRSSPNNRVEAALPAAKGSPATSASEGIAWETSHDRGLAHAKAWHRPVMIDFGAEWCEACKELELKTYVDPRVRAAAQHFVAIRIDATTIDDNVQKLLDRYGVMGLPTVVFIDSQGQLLKNPRVLGFVPADRFMTLMQQVH